MTDDQTVVGGRYQLGEVLGRGGMAEVRQGTDLRLGRAVAVKRLSPQLAADPMFQTRFQREAHAVASLNHPNIAAVFDSGEETDPETGVSIPYLVMELVAGSTLRDVLKEGRRLLPERALEITQGVLEALSHSHTGGIVHRDIKPANVMLTPDGGVKVMDFGIARAIEDTTTSLTKTASVIGTAHYLSPEQARGESVDLRSDIYSTGCLMYELLTGGPPFTGESSVSVAYQHVREDPVPPSQLDAELSPAIDAVTLKALAKDPADRYQSAKEMSDDLGRVLAGQPPLALAAGSTPAAAATTVAAAGATMVAGAAVPALAPAPAPTALAVEEEPDRRSAGRMALIAVVILALVAGLGYGLFRLFGNTGTDLVSVPAVVGGSAASADAKLRAANLSPVVVSVHGPKDKTINSVLGQSPDPGTRVPTGSDVTIKVNVGPADAKVPGGLVGKNVDDAKDALDKAGFTNVRTKKAADPPKKAEDHEVVSVDPDSGSAVALGEEITLIYVDKKTASSDSSSSPEATTDSTKSAAGPPTDQPSGSASRDDSTSEPTRSSAPPKSSEPSRSSRPPTSSKPTANPTEASGPTSSASKAKPAGEATSSPMAKATKSPKTGATDPPKAIALPQDGESTASQS